MCMDMLSSGIVGRRRYARFDVDHDATVRLGGGTAVFGRIVNLSLGGARVVLPRAIEPPRGRWIVLAGGGPFANGLDARIVGGSGRHWSIGFDPCLVATGLLPGILQPPSSVETANVPAEMPAAGLGIVRRGQCVP